MSKMYVVTDNGIYRGSLLITDEKGHWWEYNINEDHRYYGIQDEDDELIPDCYDIYDFQVDLDERETWDGTYEYVRDWEDDNEYLSCTAGAIEDVICTAKAWNLDGHDVYDNKIPFSSESLIAAYYDYLDEFKGDWLDNCAEPDTILFNCLLDGNFSRLDNDTLHKVLESLPDNVDFHNNYIPLHYSPYLYNMTIDDMIGKYIENYEKVDET